MLSRTGSPEHSPSTDDNGYLASAVPVHALHRGHLLRRGRYCGHGVSRSVRSQVTAVHQSPAPLPRRLGEGPDYAHPGTLSHELLAWRLVGRTGRAVLAGRGHHTGRDVRAAPVREAHDQGCAGGSDPPEGLVVCLRAGKTVRRVPGLADAHPGRGLRHRTADGRGSAERRGREPSDDAGRAHARAPDLSRQDGRAGQAAGQDYRYSLYSWQDADGTGGEDTPTDIAGGLERQPPRRATKDLGRGQSICLDMFASSGIQPPSHIDLSQRISTPQCKRHASRAQRSKSGQQDRRRHARQENTTGKSAFRLYLLVRN